MVSYAGIAATSGAIVGLLTAVKDAERAAAHPDTPAAALLTPSLSFEVYTSGQMQGTVATDRSVVSPYLYHLTVNPTRRRTLGRQRLLGWSVRALQDTPTLGAGVLNPHAPEPIFPPEETVEIVWELDDTPAQERNVRPAPGVRAQRSR